MDSNDLLTLRRDIELAQLRDLLWQAYLAGFDASAEGFNGEYAKVDAETELRKFFEEWVGPGDDDPWDREQVGMSQASDYLAAFQSALPEHDEKAARLRQHEEEHVELEDAIYEGNKEQVARELADVVWICYGTAYAWGIDLDVALSIIAESNMAKLESGKMNKAGKLERPPNWEAPSMKGALL